MSFLFRGALNQKQAKRRLWHLMLAHAAIHLVFLGLYFSFSERAKPFEGFGEDALWFSLRTLLMLSAVLTPQSIRFAYEDRKREHQAQDNTGLQGSIIREEPTGL